MPMKTTLVALLITIGLPARAQVLESDSLALVALYNSTAGANWTNTWDLNTPVDTWDGVAVTNGRVDSVELYQNNLVGSIPAGLGNLVNLQWLYINENQLTGSIPAQLGNLVNLSILRLEKNQLTGAIPADLGNLTNLTKLYLYQNELTDSIPAQLGNLVNLTTIHLAHNQLSGSIPAELGNITNLSQLSLYNNELSGSIPAQLGDLSNLKYISLRYNQFMGSVPAELSNLAKLEHLFLDHNQLSELPDLSTLTALAVLWLGLNRFTFEDLEPNMGVASESFLYTPQDSVGSDSTIVRRPHTNLALSIPVGGTANVYQWIKDGVDLPEATDDPLIISSVAYADSGSYVLQITNTIVPNLTLYSWPIRLVVVNLDPVLTAVPDTTIQEDDTLSIVLHGSDIYGDSLAYGAAGISARW